MTQYQGHATEESSDAIRTDIERTRNAMGNKLDRIQERVQPENLKHQAQDVVRTAVHDSTDAVVGYVRDHASDFGSTLVDVIKRNPVPAALIGVGAGWLLYESLSGHSKQNGGSNRWRTSGPYDRGYGYEGQFGGTGYSTQYGYQPSGYQTSAQGSMTGYEGESSGIVGQARHQAEHVAENVSDKVDQVTGAVSEKIGQVRHQAEHLAETIGDKVSQASGQISHLGGETRQQARQVGGQAQQLVETNPLSLGLAALAIGAAIGLALPPTRRESKIMGQWRDQVVEKAQTAASDVKQRVQEVVEEVKPELQQVARKVVDDVKATGQEAMVEVKDAVKKASGTSQGEGEKSAPGEGKEFNQWQSSERSSAS